MRHESNILVPPCSPHRPRPSRADVDALAAQVTGQQELGLFYSTEGCGCGCSSGLPTE